MPRHRPTNDDLHREIGRRKTELRRSHAAGVHQKKRDRRNDKREAIEREKRES